MSGYIKLWRKILRSQMYRHLTAKQRDVMMVLLMKANWVENEWEWGKQIFKCNPGQFVTSLKSIKTLCAPDVSTQNIRTALLRLERWHFLTNKSTKTGRLITIINWDRYQLDDPDANKEINKELTKSQQRANKELTTNEEVKNIKKGKKGKKRDMYIPKNGVPYQEIIQDLNQKANLKYKSTTPKTRALIKARFKEGFTLDDFIIVHTNQVESWSGTDMSKYLRPETLYGTKFESYLNQPKQTQRLSKTLSHNVQVVKGMFDGETEPKRVG